MINKSDLNKKIMEDHSIKEYTLYEESAQTTSLSKTKPPKPIERYTRRPHPMDNQQEHMWYGEWENTTSTALKDYQNLMDQLRKHKTKVEKISETEKIDKIRAEIEKCQALLDKINKNNFEE